VHDAVGVEVCEPLRHLQPAQRPRSSCVQLRRRRRRLRRCGSAPPARVGALECFTCMRCTLCSCARVCVNQASAAVLAAMMAERDAERVRADEVSVFDMLRSRSFFCSECVQGAAS
jgi:hypothetical protein